MSEEGILPPREIYPCLRSDIAEIVARLGDAADDFAGKTVLLTGARGFLGRYFVAVFAHLNDDRLSAPCKVMAVDNLITTGAEENAIAENRHIRVVEHDVIRPIDIDEPLHYIVHGAGIASPFYYRAYPIETLEVAVTGTKNLLELAKRHRARFTFFSSSEIYGDPDRHHIPTPESYRGNVACQGPRACYDESKRLGETLCYIYHEEFGVHSNMLRPFNIYGPCMREDDYRVLPNFASRIKAGRPISVYGSGRQTRTYCYVTDAIVGFLLTMLRGVPGEPYNIGNPSPEISVVDLAARIEKVLGKKVDYNTIEYPDSYPADEPMRRCPDIRKARLQLKYEPRVDLDDGLQRFFAWTDEFYSGQR